MWNRGWFVMNEFRQRLLLPWIIFTCFLTSGQTGKLTFHPEFQQAEARVNVEGRDISVRPGDNFFRYANGTYLDQLTIPPDRSIYSMGSLLSDNTQQRIHSLLEAAAHHNRSGTLEQLAGDYYSAFMDEPRIERLGLAPILPALHSIRGASSRQVLASVMSTENSSLVGSLFH